MILCDRGTLDGVAYWPGTTEEFCAELSVDQTSELNRYHAVIHLRTPTAEQGYDNSNPPRVEGAALARDIDEAIELAWRDHPRRTIVDSAVDFPAKARHALAAISAELPACCDPPQVESASPHGDSPEYDRRHDAESTEPSHGQH